MSNGELHFVECFAWPRGLFFISHHIVHICLPSFLLVTNNSGEQFPASGCNLQRPLQIIPHPSHLLHHQFGGRRSRNRFGCGTILCSILLCLLLLPNTSPWQGFRLSFSNGYVCFPCNAQYVLPIGFGLNYDAVHRHHFSPQVQEVFHQETRTGVRILLLRLFLHFQQLAIYEIP